MLVLIFRTLQKKDKMEYCAVAVPLVLRGVLAKTWYMNKVIEKLKEGLADVYWLSGISRAGKSTTACILAGWYGFHIHHRDDAIQAHFERATPDLHPETCKIKKVLEGIEPEWSEFAHGPIDTDSKSYLGWLREDWDMTTEDLLALLPEFSGQVSSFIIEGHRLLPEGVQELLSDLRRAVWLAPSRLVVEERLSAGWTFMTDRFSDHEYGKRRITEIFFTASESLAAAAENLGLGIVRVREGDKTDEIAARVTRHYGLPLP